jgi:hypothetical protein
VGEARQREPVLMAVAVVGSILVHGSIVAGMLVVELLGLTFPGSDQDDGDRPDSVGIVPARLVRLGDEPEPNKLPDRVVPALPTAPNDGIPVAQELEPPEPLEKNKNKRPLNPVEDERVRDVLSRVRAFGEVTDNITTMGHPDGVPGGDVAHPDLAQVGSLWAREVSTVIKAYVTFPTIIPPEELQRLRCKIEVTVGEDLIPEEARLARRGSSNNRFFDQAVLDSFEQMRLKRVKLPRPPAALERQLFGAGLIINLYGRDLN